MEEINKNEYLDEVLYSHKMCHIEKRTDKYKEIAKDLRDAVMEHYGNKKMYPTFLSGSIAKHTAVNTKFDIDFVIPFRRDSFDTLEAMYEDVHTFLKTLIKDNEKYRAANLKKQTVSIGFTILTEVEGSYEEISIDVVPGRELKQDDYGETRDLNLYFCNPDWGFLAKDSTYQKTNIQKQSDTICGKENERKIIRLLKVWKKANNKDIKSFALELFVIKAMDGYDGAKDLWSMLKHVLQYIAEHATDKSCHLLDPGNSNNDVLEKMDDVKRSYLQREMKNLVEGIERNDWYIKQAFPVNQKFPKVKDSYGMRPGNQVPLPPTNKHFG